MRNPLFLLLLINFIFIFSSNAQTEFREIELKVNYHNGSRTVCENNHVSLEVNSISDTPYTWVKNDIVFTTTGVPYLEVLEPGIYSVKFKFEDILYSSNNVELKQCYSNTENAPNTTFSKPENTGDKINSSLPSIIADIPTTCNNQDSVTMKIVPSNPSYSYQWYKQNTSNYQYEAIPSATDSTLKTVASGRYQVSVFDGVNLPFNSNSFYLLSEGVLRLKNDNGDLVADNILAVGDTLNLFAELIGPDLPFEGRLENGKGSTGFTMIESPFNLKVVPTMNRQFTVNTYFSQNRCGTFLNSQGSRQVAIIDDSTSVNFESPEDLEVCAGETLFIDYSKIGTWDIQNNKVSMILVPETGSAYSFGTSFQNPLPITVSPNAELNTRFKLSATGIVPYFTSVESAFNFTVTEVGCPTEAIIKSSEGETSCFGLRLEAYPTTSEITGALYQWFFEDEPIPGAINSYYFVYNSGNYKVRVYNENDYNSTSRPYEVFIKPFQAGIEIIEGSGCLNDKEVILKASSPNASYSYKWLYSDKRNSEYSNLNVVDSVISVSIPGFYKLEINNGLCSSTSRAFSFSKEDVMFSTKDDFSTKLIEKGDTVSLKLLFTGNTGPFNFTIDDGKFEKSYFSKVNPAIIKVSPQASRRYIVSEISTGCDFLGRYDLTANDVLINIEDRPSIKLMEPLSLDVCAGDIIEIPFEKTGNWGEDFNVLVGLKDLSSNITHNYFTWEDSLNSIKLPIPPYYVVGTKYKVMVIGNTIPILNPSFIESSFELNLVSNNCFPSEAYLRNSGDCSSKPNYSAYPNGGSYTYQWFYNNTVMTGHTSAYLYDSRVGTFKVKVTNSLGQTIESNEVVSEGNIFGENVYPYLSNSGSAPLCDNSGSANYILNYTSLNSGVTWKWYGMENSTGGLRELAETGPNLSIPSPGRYSIVLKSGDCERVYETNTCETLLLFDSISVCKGQKIFAKMEVKDLGYPFRADSLVLQLVDVTGSTLIADSLTLINRNFSANETKFDLEFTLPNFVSSGDYRLRVIRKNGFIGPLSHGVLNVKAFDKPNSFIQSSNDFITSGESVSLSIQNCTNGTIQWDNGFDGTTRVETLSKSKAYKAICKTENCISDIMTKHIRLDCDPLEMNDIHTSSSKIKTINYESEILCIDYIEDEDWFVWVFNGKPFYFKVSVPYSVPENNLYKVKLTYSENQLIFETLEATLGQYFYNSIHMYDSDGVALLSSAVSNKSNGFSKITYSLTEECPEVKDLYSTLLDIEENEVTNPRAEKITATNKVKDSSTSVFKAENNVILNPGFETKIINMGSFEASIEGCPE
ncbi:3-coathanger stack domain-containing protein [Arcticibacterium luteifluviistationis]|uniref:Ig-like domain-containing protein n=1 Tax=Arcticibacterium luteifluviistationis TaxID=1784714 RepID=A0A2Z4GE44_9BACT|nr:3-coathanger stack domain-containing protein [Arcticibacterium luteifluviistationis]AWV99411.1 hypothetical protein DJ013_15075 [Arcticibacterium luteifluviistationis]